jgi:hypothetical protein
MYCMLEAWIASATTSAWGEMHVIVVLLTAAALTVLAYAWRQVLREPREDAQVTVTTEWHRVGGPVWDDAWHTAYGAGVQATRVEEHRFSAFERPLHWHIGIRKLP